MSKPNTITYLRTGRTVRAKGEIIETNRATGLFKVKPSRPKWKTIWISIAELQQGGSPAPANPHHIPAVGKMVEGLRQLLARKEKSV